MISWNVNWYPLHNECKQFSLFFTEDETTLSRYLEAALLVLKMGNVSQHEEGVVLDLAIVRNSAPISTFSYLKT